MNLLFFDCETTGLDPHKHEIVSVSCTLTDETNKMVLGARTFYVHPERLSDATTEALGVNGYSFDRWRLQGTVTRGEMVVAIDDLSKGAVLVGHNVKFDEAFMEAAFVAEGVQPSWDYHSVDTVSLAWPLYQGGLIEKLSLDSLCKFFKQTRSSVHSAEEDVKLTRRIYSALLEYYKLK